MDVRGHRQKFFPVLLLPLLALPFLWGCAAKKPAQPRAAAAAPQPARPAWVDKGGSAITGDRGEKILYGVGLASGVADPALRREVADASARADLARTLQTWVAASVKVYRESTAKSGAATEAQHFESTMRDFTKAKLVGSQIVDHWMDPRENALYALAALSLDKRSLEEYLRDQGFEEAERKQVVESAERAFDELGSPESQAP